MSTTPKKYQLYISHNLGISYDLAYETDDKDDYKLGLLMDHADENYLRHYLTTDGDISGACRIHASTLQMLSGDLAGDTLTTAPYKSRTIEEQAQLLSCKFGQKKQNARRASQ